MIACIVTRRCSRCVFTLVVRASKLTRCYCFLTIFIANDQFVFKTATHWIICAWNSDDTTTTATITGTALASRIRGFAATRFFFSQTFVVFAPILAGCDTIFHAFITFDQLFTNTTFLTSFFAFPIRTTICACHFIFKAIGIAGYQCVAITFASAFVSACFLALAQATWALFNNLDYSILAFCHGCIGVVTSFICPRTCCNTCTILATKCAVLCLQNSIDTSLKMTIFRASWLTLTHFTCNSGSWFRNALTFLTLVAFPTVF